VTGWGLVEAAPRGPRWLAAGAAAPVGGAPAARLADLAGRIALLIEQWQPTAVAMECAFVGRSASSALRLGEVRGALLAAAGMRGVAVVDYSPATVKAAVTGSGRAEKDAVARGVDLILGGRNAPGDSTDALAVAICHLLHARTDPRLGEVSRGASRKGVRLEVRRG
jgi:crossover junction endodeoxyribonuclease RuvC